MGMVLYTVSPSTEVAEAGRFLRVLGQPVLIVTPKLQRNRDSKNQKDRQTTEVEGVVTGTVAQLLPSIHTTFQEETAPGSKGSAQNTKMHTPNQSFTPFVKDQGTTEGKSVLSESDKS